MGRTEPWPTPCVQSRRKGPEGRLRSAEDEETTRRGLQNTKEQTVAGRKLRNRSMMMLDQVSCLLDLAVWSVAT